MMTWERYKQERFEAGRKAGKKEGRKEGRKIVLQEAKKILDQGGTITAEEFLDKLCARLTEMREERSQ